LVHKGHYRLGQGGDELFNVFASRQQQGHVGNIFDREGIAQNLRPAGMIDYRPNKNWDFQANTAFASTRSFHVYDATQNGFSVTYARPFRRRFHDDSGTMVLQYPIRFSAGLQEETFFNFTGGQSTQLRPYIRVSLF